MFPISCSFLQLGNYFLSNHSLLSLLLIDSQLSHFVIYYYYKSLELQRYHSFSFSNANYVLFCLYKVIIKFLQSLCRLFSLPVISSVTKSNRRTKWSNLPHFPLQLLITARCYCTLIFCSYVLYILCVYIFYISARYEYFFLHQCLSDVLQH